MAPCPRVCHRSHSPGSPTTISCPFFSGGLSVALVSFADTSVLSRTYAARTRTYVDPQPGNGRSRRRQSRCRFFPGLSHQQQLIPHSRCRGRRRRTQITERRRRDWRCAPAPCGPEPAPKPSFQCARRGRIASAIGLIEIRDLIRIYRVQQWEFWLSMVCFAGVAILGAIPGIAVAIVIAIIEFLLGCLGGHTLPSLGAPKG